MEVAALPDGRAVQPHLVAVVRRDEQEGATDSGGGGEGAGEEKRLPVADVFPPDPARGGRARLRRGDGGDLDDARVGQRQEELRAAAGVRPGRSAPLLPVEVRTNEDARRGPASFARGGSHGEGLAHTDHGSPRRETDGEPLGLCLRGSGGLRAVIPRSDLSRSSTHGDRQAGHRHVK